MSIKIAYTKSFRFKLMVFILYKLILLIKVKLLIAKNIL